jgi:hypothetical protein
LVGLENQSRAENADSVSLVDDGNIISQGDLFDALAENPLESKTERTLAKKPLPKLAFVAAGLLVVFGIGGFAISSMMSSKKPNFTNPLTNKTEAKTSIVEKKVDESNESGELKTQLAISKQEDDLKQLMSAQKIRRKRKESSQGTRIKKRLRGKTKTRRLRLSLQVLPPPIPQRHVLIHLSQYVRSLCLHVRSLLHVRPLCLHLPVHGSPLHCHHLLLRPPWLLTH